MDTHSRSVLPAEEKERLIDRVTFEAEIRKELAPPAEPKARWWESRLGLLLIGSALSGVLVPFFQYTQETVKWRRQNRYDNAKFRLTMMRDCLREFVTLSALTAEAHELTRLETGKADRERFREGYRDLQKRRFLQNARVAAMIVHFRNRESIARQFNDYLVTVEQYLAGVRAAMDAKQPADPGGSKEPNSLDPLIESTNGAYERVIQHLKQEIGRAEDEGEGFM